ncbi:terminase [Achromobacter mucicolens]|uniref:terminase n=1 Tax=Achromobacter mucicolens TaxID=1389922 RepID=UPI0024485C09|nr:terminase [Achromobacter mucicolens]MDG9966943.1 terminase [Achromobacter mucicolens]
MTKSAAAVGASRSVVYEWRMADEEFAKAWDQAIRVATLGLEDEARRRAQDGVDEPVFYLGAECGTVRKYSDTLLIFLLKAHDHKYREKTGLELTGLNGGPVQMSDSQVAGRLAALIAVAQARQAQELADEPGADLV